MLGQIDIFSRELDDHLLVCRNLEDAAKLASEFTIHPICFQTVPRPPEGGLLKGIKRLSWVGRDGIKLRTEDKSQFASSSNVTRT